METSDHSKNGAVPKSQTSRTIKPIEMKKILVVILLVTIAVVSCKKDDADVLSPEMLAGTKWMTDDKETSVEFKSKIEVIYIWTDHWNGMTDEVDNDGLYSINGNNITLDFGDNYTVKGVYDNSSITFVDDGETFVVKKQ